MTVEERAKAYDEAFGRAKEKHAMFEGMKQGDVLEDVFPELKESEDERIRKAIHIYLDWLDGRKDYAPKGKYTIKDMIAWLEKQGEWKPSDEQMKALKEACDEHWEPDGLDPLYKLWEQLKRLREE